MNRDLFISDYKQMSRLYPPEELPVKLADYIGTMNDNPLHNPVESKVSKDKVIGLTCGYFEVTLCSMIEKNRSESIKYARQVTIYLLKRRCRMTYADIGRWFHRDHSTTMQSCQRINDLMDSDPVIREEIAALNAQL